jgi:magnesium chelatase family protein
LLAKVYSCAVIGLEGMPVEVEVDISQGLPSFQIVGLPDTAVQESKERVRAAVKNSGASFPMKRLTVNLAPADLRKAGPAYDLPIAIGLLLASDQVGGQVERALFVGELGLDGKLRHTEGVLPMVSIARRHGIETVYVPFEDAPEASLIDGATVIPVRSLSDLAAHLTGERQLMPYLAAPIAPEAEAVYPVDFQDIKGQEHAKRALEIAAAGGHNMLMSGSPGAGKTLMARAVPSILPPMRLEESLEVTKIYSVSGMLPADRPLIRQRPFCAPHHTISQAGLVGGGSKIKPGEITRAHRGVLFLDELPEFGMQTLEVLRQPLEDRLVTISRASGSITFPANFILIAAMNPCPCGWHGDAEKQCTCSPSVVARYQKRISGPLLDRIDIHVEVARVQYEKLASDRQGEPSAAVRERVTAARLCQAERFAQGALAARMHTNADMGPAEVRVFCRLDGTGERLMQAAMRQLQLSARGYHRVLKLARTIADLAGAPEISAVHLAEALQYRPRSVE